MRQLKVYITGPMSMDKRADVAVTLRQAGHDPTFEPGVLQNCDAVIRLPGDSVEADSATTRAQGLKIPVYTALEWFLLKNGG